MNPQKFFIVLSLLAFNALVVLFSYNQNLIHTRESFATDELAKQAKQANDQLIKTWALEKRMDVIISRVVDEQDNFPALKQVVQQNDLDAKLSESRSYLEKTASQYDKPAEAQAPQGGLNGLSRSMPMMSPNTMSH